MVKVAGEGVPLLYLTIVFLILSWLTFVVRVGVRRWINAFGSDDWLMAGGLVCPQFPVIFTRTSIAKTTVTLTP